MVGMKRRRIFCIGLSRTGTTSICRALEILGYNATHFPIILFINPEMILDSLKFNPQRKLNLYWKWRLEKEMKVVKEKSGYKDLFTSYNAFGDLPIPLYFKELDTKFPGSKFIYTYRDEEKWLRSMRWLYKEGSALWNHGLLHDEIKLAAYGTYTYNEFILKEKFRQHHQHVMEYFANRPSDFLAIKIDEKEIDFSLLCDFLQIATPDIAYPKMNAVKAIAKSRRVHYWLERKIPFYSILKRRMHL